MEYHASTVVKRIGRRAAALCVVGICAATTAMAQLPTACPGNFPWDVTYDAVINSKTYTFLFNATAPFTADKIPGTNTADVSRGRYTFGTLTSTDSKATGYNAYIQAHCEVWSYPLGEITEVIDDGAHIPQIIVLQEEESEENLGPCDDMENCDLGGGDGGGGDGGGGDGGSLELWRFCYWTDYYDDNWNYLYSSTPSCHYEWL